MLGTKVKFGPNQTICEIIQVKEKLHPQANDVYVFKGPRGGKFLSILRNGIFIRLT